MLQNRYADRYIIDTPESIEFGYDIVGIGPRLLAGAIDFLPIIAAFIMIYVDGSPLQDLGYNNPGLVFMLTTFAYCAYYILFEVFWNGQTPGKRLFGIRVIQETGKPITLTIALIRNLARLIDFFPYMYSLALLMMLFNKRHRRLGDFAAGTLVVRARSQVGLDELIEMARVNNVANALAENSKMLLPNLAALKPQEMAVVQDFLRQAPSFPQDRRQRMAGQLAYALFQRLGYSVPGDAELFLSQANDQFIVLQAQNLQQQSSKLPQ